MVAKKLHQPGAMKVWKSPVLYFGVLLVVAVAALLLAPFIVDWNGYRADLEAYGKKLTGREVRIEGAISARLFPWPRLTAENVTIANPPELAEKEFAAASRIIVRMSLGGLLQGGIDVESIEVEEPTINFERLAAGGGNWAFQPSADLTRSDVLSRVKLDKITLTGGTLNFRDRRRGETVTLDDVTADLASPGVTGPWRIRSRALYNDRPLDIAVNTATYAEGQPFLFGVKVGAADKSGYVYSFDGTYNQGTAEGGVLVEPAQNDEGKGDAEGRIRPLIFSAKAKGNFESVALSDIQVSREQKNEGGALATGSATIRLGKQIDAEFDLSASMLDLDELAGAKSRDLLRQAGSLALIDSLLSLLPSDMSLTGSAKVTALKSDGQTFDNAVLAIEADRERLRINRLSSGLPGRSQVLFTGNYFPAPGGGELAGDLALETSDLRELAMWMWRSGRATLGPLWTGSRGRLKMQSGLSLTPSRLRLTGTEFELDGERGTGALSVTSAGGGAVDLALETAHFDLDSYAPQGIPAFSDAAREGVGGIIAFALPQGEVPDLRLKVKFGELKLNAVTAQNVAVDLQSGANGLDLRALDIGAVGGASLTASGLVLDNGKGADGSVSLEVKADNPDELIRLLGLAASDGLPPWARGLGQTALRADLAVKPGAGGSSIKLNAGGTAGDLTLSLRGAVEPDMKMSGSAKISAPTSSRIVSLLGLTMMEQDAIPGSISIDAEGDVKGGFTASATLQVLDARLDYQGAADPFAEGFGLNGQLSLRATDTAPLIGAAGVPVASGGGGVVVLDSPLVWADGKWTLSTIAGRFAGQPLSGEASLTPGLVLDGRLKTGTVVLRDVMAAALIDWSGPEPGLDAGFARSLPFGLTGQLWITPSGLQVHPHFLAKSAEIGIEVKDGEIRLAVAGKDEDGRDVRIDLGSTGSDESRKISGSLRLPVDLAHQLALVGGAQVASGEGEIDLRFDSEGRSPAAALSAARGEGKYALEDFHLTGVTPAAFTSALASARDSAGVTQAFDAMRGGQGVDFGDVSGTVALNGGEMVFSPLTHADGDADITVRTVVDLAQSGIDMDVGLALKAREKLPPMSVAYAGPPMALARSENNSELATSLGVTIMQEGITELERLQQEQARLAKLEEQQRIEDEARLQAYYAQRDEILLRKRELKVHAEMAVIEADRLRRRIEAERAANAEMNKAEIRQRLRELRTWRRQARLTEADQPKPAAEVQEVKAQPVEQVSAPQPPVPPPKPAQSRPKPKQLRATSKPIAPVILANPRGAPVIISAPPGSPPSQ
ncbi:AsmA family protein [Aestuariivirga sp.]|uniref:AsmA family protein n=1 Tax=Aestuariivirga sp. TaxID=2650926 RepID=UPI003BAB684C